MYIIKEIFFLRNINVSKSKFEQINTSTFLGYSFNSVKKIKYLIKKIVVTKIENIIF